jgi:hypothetical protein
MIDGAGLEGQEDCRSRNTRVIGSVMSAYFIVECHRLAAEFAILCVFAQAWRELACGTGAWCAHSAP